MERALSIVHVAGLELIAEIKVDEQTERTARRGFEEALAAFDDALGTLGILLDDLRSVGP
jgi:hypothetical protein